MTYHAGEEREGGSQVRDLIGSRIIFPVSVQTNQNNDPSLLHRLNTV
jgi:hypothetical protein